MFRYGVKTMLDNSKSSRDTFTFSLRGMRTVGGFIAMPIIADDRVRQRRDDRDTNTRLWLRSQPQA